jgi:hypothetical protein
LLASTIFVKFKYKTMDKNQIIRFLAFFWL